MPVLVALLASAALPARSASQQSARGSTPDADDWLAYNRSPAGDRYSPLRQITAANVARLRPVCTFDTKERVAFQTGPLVVDTGHVYALDAKSGALVGYIQLVKHDFHDRDVDARPMLVTTRGGASLVVSANKDGLLSAVDRSEARGAIAATTDLQRRNLAMMAGDIIGTLALRYQVPTTRRENTDLRMSVSGRLRFCPGAQGGSSSPRRPA